MAVTQMSLLPGYTTQGQDLFKKRSASIIHSLNARIKKSGVPGRLSLEDGRRILAQAIGKPCRYCRKPVKIANVSADHPMPISLGGNPFEIEGICKSCNEIKGNMCAQEFEKFLAFVKTMSPEGGADLIRRLHAGAFGIRMMAQMSGRTGRKKQAEKMEAIVES